MEKQFITGQLVEVIAGKHAGEVGLIGRIDGEKYSLRLGAKKAGSKSAIVKPRIITVKLSEIEVLHG
jgi:transcription antitermination factor NusG